MRDSSPVQTLCVYLSCLAGSQVGLVMASTGNRMEEVYEGDAEELRDYSHVQTLSPYLSCRVGLVMAETGNRRMEKRW